MKEKLYVFEEVPMVCPYTTQLTSADGKPLMVVITDESSHYGLWLYIPSTGEKAQIAEFTEALTMGIILGEFERKYEAVFAHVVHHRQTIPYTPGKHIYYGLPPFECVPKVGLTYHNTTN